jgi:hypothetical protein
MMNGLLASINRLQTSEIEPVVAAAVASFGFVFIHPFSDGNGRIHRLLIHYMLSRAGFTSQRPEPEGPPERSSLPIRAVCWSHAEAARSVELREHIVRQFTGGAPTDGCGHSPKA